MEMSLKALHQPEAGLSEKTGGQRQISEAEIPDRFVLLADNIN